MLYSDYTNSPNAIAKADPCAEIDCMRVPFVKYCSGSLPEPDAPAGGPHKGFGGRRKYGSADLCKRMENYGMSQEEVAKKLGKGRSTIANWTRVLNLEPRVLEMAKEGKITEGHCKALLMITDPEKQYLAATQLLERGITVRQMEQKSKINVSKEEEKRNHILYKKIEDTFQGFFGSKVRLNPGKRRGKIVIEYTSNDDLERIMGLLNK